MKYAVWFVRLLFAAWFIPAGLNHFVPLFPQPLGSQPLSRELFSALFDSQLFDFVKAVELLAGISVLTGWRTPLVLIMCMPVSFCVFYWDMPLEGRACPWRPPRSTARRCCCVTACSAWPTGRAIARCSPSAPARGRSAHRPRPPPPSLREPEP